MKKFKIKRFDDVRKNLVPRVYARATIGTIVPSYFKKAGFGPPSPYHVVAEHLGVTVVKDDTEFGGFLRQEEFERWGSFPELWDIGFKNLQQRQVKPTCEQGLYAFESDRIRVANHILFTETLGALEVDGDLILQVPSEYLLLVCGSNDPSSLNRMADRATAAVQSRGGISGFAFRLVGGRLETWLPPREHPSFCIFRELELASLMYAYDSLLPIAAGRSHRPAACMRVYSAQTGEPLSTCTLLEGLPTIFPKTDTVVLSRSEFLGFAYWDELREIADELIHKRDSYPESWSVGGTESVELFDRVEGRLHPMAEIPVNPN